VISLALLWPTQCDLLVLAAFVVGMGIVHNALRANAFAVTVVRLQEERVLRARLPGYEDHAREVRWRLLPGIW
jgi:protein-S-isoprenylcysteine O-methyltransferase Ste14